MQVRIAVGSEHGQRSMAWKLWSKRSDAYLVARPAGGTMHVSFHESGRCHIKTKSSFARFLSLARGHTSPYLDTWIARPDAHPGVALAFRIFVPASQLRTHSASEDKPIIWIMAPRDGFTSEISIVFDECCVDPKRFRGQIVLRHQLILLVLHRAYKDTDGIARNIADIVDLFNANPTVLKKVTAHVDFTMARIILGDVEANGTRYVQEIALDSVFPLSES